MLQKAISAAEIVKADPLFEHVPNLSKDPVEAHLREIKDARVEVAKVLLDPANQELKLPAPCSDKNKTEGLTQKLASKLKICSAVMKSLQK